MASSKTFGYKALALTAGVASSLAIGTNLFLANGTTSSVRIDSTGVIVSTGGLIPISGSLTLTETDKYGSGTLSITNPTSKILLCNPPIFDITTNSSPVTKFDVYTATGSLAQMGGTRGANTGTNILANNYTTTVGVTVLSGSSLQDGALNPKPFKLWPTTTTTSVNRINIVSLVQTGGSLVGTYRINCNFTN